MEEIRLNKTAQAKEKRAEVNRLKALRKARAAEEQDTEDNDQSEDEEIREAIDIITDGANANEVTGKKRERKQWVHRSKNWMNVAEYYDRFGAPSTLIAFPEIFKDCTESAARQRLKRWSMDLKDNKTVIDSRRKSVLGTKLETILCDDLEARRDLGLDIGNDVLRNLVVTLLNKEGMTDLLRGHGGTNTFCQGWCSRFWNRHTHLKSGGSKRKRTAHLSSKGAAPVTINAPAPPVLHRTAVLSMKVVDLRSALSSRGLNADGQKAELMLRLIDALA
jgi:hypothetical protein